MGLIRVIPAADRRDRSGPAPAPVVDGVPDITSAALRPAAHPRVHEELAAVACGTDVPGTVRTPGWCWVDFHDIEEGPCAPR